jgi:hypothetical protein
VLVIFSSFFYQLQATRFLSGVIVTLRTNARLFTPNSRNIYIYYSQLYISKVPRETKQGYFLKQTKSKSGASLVQLLS